MARASGRDEQLGRRADGRTALEGSPRLRQPARSMKQDTQSFETEGHGAVVGPKWVLPTTP